MILESAEALLLEGGPSGVQVRAVASRLGLTDAAIYHHFGSRDRLLQALLNHGGRKLRAEIAGVAKRCRQDHADLPHLVDALAQLHASGYADLALALHMSGHRDDGVGLLDPLVDALHARRRAAALQNHKERPSKTDTRLALAALHQAMFADALFGEAFRRSAGIQPARAGQSGPTRRWWVKTLRTVLELDEE